jgi:hypothetical protein
VKAYILNANPILPFEHVHRILNNTSAVDTWVSPFQGCAIVLSRLTVSELAAVLQTHFSGVWFLLVEANQDNSNGWLPPQFWEYMSNPHKAWSDKILAGLLKQSPPPPPPINLRAHRLPKG